MKAILWGEGETSGGEARRSRKRCLGAVAAARWGGFGGLRKNVDRLKER